MKSTASRGWQSPASHPALALLRLARSHVPQAWSSNIRRKGALVASLLPNVLRERAVRVLQAVDPDMGAIGRDYPMWIELYDQMDATTRGNILANIDRLPRPPLISVLMPVFNPVPGHLQAAIRSVCDQLYPFWELCISDDRSTDPAVLEVLRDAAAGDDRIKLLRRERNGHISAASNSALRLASGQFVALLDHDDILPPHALYEVAATVTDQPEVDIIYSDEDHIDNSGRRSHPYFKPDWNPELMLGQNLISHLGVYRRELLERIGGFRTGFEGSQDHDLALRAVAATTAARIVHIPKVLYHWRQGATDKTFSESSHERCVRNARRAVQEFLATQQPAAKAEPAPLIGAWTRVVRPLPDPAPLVSIILPFQGPASVLAAGLEALLNKTDYPALEIVVPVGGSAPALPQAISGDARLRFVKLSPAMPSRTAEAARGSLLLMLDAHLQPVDPDWLKEMVSRVVCSDTGAVGAKLLLSNGRVSHAGLVVDGNKAAFSPFLHSRGNQIGYFGHLQLARDVTAVSGRCLLVKRQALEAVGGFDETLKLIGYGDVDLCLRLAEAGYRVVWTPFAQFHGSDRRQTGRPSQALQSAESLHGKWGPNLRADRYWNPNLACTPTEIRLAFPPRTLAVAQRQPAVSSSDIEVVQ